MNTFEAFLRSQAALGQPRKVFDWHKAADLIRERQPVIARAGLRDDWEWTGGTIWQDGQPVANCYSYLGSNWATPELNIDGEIVECWVWQDDSPGWTEETKWPETALERVRAIPWRAT